jgi:hypothetical protein
MRAIYSGAIGVLDGADAIRSQARRAMLFFKRMGRVTIMANSSIPRTCKGADFAPRAADSQDDVIAVPLPVVSSLQAHRSGTECAVRLSIKAVLNDYTGKDKGEP